MAKQKEINENEARASLNNASISTKMSVEICSFIRKKNLVKAKEMLQEIIEKKKALPIKRYNKDLAHKKKIGPGRYPEKACKEILKLLKQVEANAQFKGLSTGDLLISYIKADKASTPWRYGRQRRRKMKRTNVEIIVIEKIDNKTKTEAKEKPKKEEKKESKQEKTKNKSEKIEDKKEDKEQEKKEEKTKVEPKKEVKEKIKKAPDKTEPKNGNKEDSNKK
jgi:large subunit ribosomal protein L22